ncbi:MAG: multi-sensor signal transduction histidine kinase [Alphaproteobacteria bacterium]|nr:multi-sensor signal transduction histidine kinase [Alphaproteobacteria bacterium]
MVTSVRHHAIAASGTALVPAPGAAHPESHPRLPFSGTSDMAEIMRARDWSATPLGDPAHWSVALSTAVSLCLGSRLCSCVYWGADFRILYNDAYGSILGTKHSWALGRPAREVWPEMFRIIGPLLQETYETGATTGSDDAAIFLNRFGYIEEFYCSFSYAPLFGADGGIEAVYAILPETSKRVIGERRLQTLQRLGNLGNSITGIGETLALISGVIADNPYDIPFAAFYLWDESGLEARLTATAGIGRGATLAPLTVRADGDSLYAPLLKRVHSRQIETLRLPVDLTDLPDRGWGGSPSSLVIVPFVASMAEGPRGFMVAAANALKRVDKDYLLFFHMVGDQIAKSITGAFVHEQESARITALAELNKAKTRFFNDISHELRTPLTLMLGPLEEFINSAAGLTQEQQGNLSLSHRNGKRLLKLVNDLLEFSRSETGHAQPSFEPVDLSTETAAIARTFDWASRQMGIRLSIACPKLSEPIYVDREMWEKIVLNLVSNAFKYTNEGEIRISLAETKKSVLLRVKDSGIGIAAADLGRVFDRFYRVEGASGRTSEGTGIGLALVKELTERNGGRVWAESKPERGSTFTVELPMGSQHLPQDRILPARTGEASAGRMRATGESTLAWVSSEAQGAVLASPASAPSSNAGQSKKRVLVVDDNADLRSYISSGLSHAFDVETVSSGAEALASIARDPPALILSDLMMPGIDGLSLLRKLRSRSETATLPIILLTARADEQSKLQGLEDRADDYLVKPFDMRELVARAQAAVALAELRADVAQQHERVHLARDLHDSLLQSIQGAGLMLEAALDRLAGDEEQARPLLANCQQALSKAVEEGRALLGFLRISTKPRDDFAEALERLRGEFLPFSPAKLSVNEEGRRRDISASAWPDLYGICREAIANAVRHADATSIEVQIRYGRSLQIRVGDDGDGIDARFVVSGRSGHFGLTGMRERAARLKGRLNIAQQTPRGTLVKLSIPGAVAYSDGKNRSHDDGHR